MTPDIDAAAGEYEIDGEAAILQSYGRIFERHFEKHYTSTHRPPRRAIHAKCHAFLNAELEVFEHGDPQLRHGIFDAPAVFPAVARISNGDGPAGPDTDWVASIGFAFKVFGVRRPKYLQTQREDTQDFLFLNQPAYIASDIRDFTTLMQAIDGGVVSKAIAFVRNFKGLRYRRQASPKDNPLNTRFWGVAPFRLQDVSVKYLLRPVEPQPKDIPRKRTPDYLKDLVKGWIEHRPAAFDLFLQKRLLDGRELRNMPIEDYAVAWDERQSVPIRVGRLSIPAQRVDDEFERKYGEPMVFSPWNTTRDFRPLGSLNRARRVVYQLSSSRRGGATVSPFAQG
jgi:hypothetical protein